LRRLIGERFALIPQDPMTALNPGRRIEGQLTDGLRLIRRLDAGAARRIALRLLAEVHIREPERVLRSFPHELSGGMRQRVLIAAAFALEPTLIIADEPTTALDVTVQKQILRLIRNMQSAHGTAVVFVTHDLGVVAQICDHVTLLFAGGVVEEGRTADVLEAPKRAYTRALLEASPRFDRPDAGLRRTTTGRENSALSELSPFASPRSSNGEKFHADVVGIVPFDMLLAAIACTIGAFRRSANARSSSCAAMYPEPHKIVMLPSPLSISARRGRSGFAGETTGTGGRRPALLAIGASDAGCSATSPGRTTTETRRLPTASRIATSRVRGIRWAPEINSQ